MLSKRIYTPILLFVAALFLTACGGPEQQNLQGQTMGRTIRLNMLQILRAKA